MVSSGLGEARYTENEKKTLQIYGRNTVVQRSSILIFLFRSFALLLNLDAVGEGGKATLAR
eukprot:GDKH01015036.1.p2 GENE.GDKH01015036.1~~GDKH01015036.1.p2  ORF type:complete len:61 (+),score=6.65 GDKH01015036.1:113-295(+)